MRSVLVLFLAAGCADDLPEGSLLERTRVLAVSARPAGDATRAWPRPGEETALTFLLAGPADLPPMSWAATLCVKDAQGCAPFLSTQGSGRPEVRFVAPEADRLVLVAQVVPDGEPETVVAMELGVERQAANHHPRAPELSLAGRPWGEACEPVGAAPVEIAVATRGDDREPFIDGDGAAQRETLRLSFFATAGELEGQFRVVEPTDPDDKIVSMTWTPPEMPDGGLEMRFTVVARDLRGGVAWTQRALCASK